MKAIRITLYVIIAGIVQISALLFMDYIITGDIPVELSKTNFAIWICCMLWVTRDCIWDESREARIIRLCRMLKKSSNSEFKEIAEAIIKESLKLKS